MSARLQRYLRSESCQGPPFSRQPPQGVGGETSCTLEERFPSGAPGRELRYCSCPAAPGGAGPKPAALCPWPPPSAWARPVPRLSSAAAKCYSCCEGKLRTFFTRVSAPPRLISAWRGGPGPCRGQADTEAPCEGSQRHLVAAPETAACAPRAGQRALPAELRAGALLTRVLPPEISFETLSVKAMLTKLSLPLFLMKSILFSGCFIYFYLCCNFMDIFFCSGRRKCKIFSFMEVKPTYTQL